MNCNVRPAPRHARARAAGAGALIAALLTPVGCAASESQSPSIDEQTLVVWHQAGDDTWGGLQVATHGDGDVAVVLLHGYGARGDDLVDFAVRLHRQVPALYVIPRGPMETAREGDGRAWFDPPTSHQHTRRERREGRRESGESGARLQDILTTLQAHGIPPEHVIVAGFSQGAVMSAQLALCGERRLAGLALMSGSELPHCADSDLAAGMPVFVAHGRQDEVLPVEDGLDAARELDEAGAQVEPHLFEGGHEMTRTEGRQLADWLARVVRGLRPIGAEHDILADSHAATVPR